MENAAAPFEPVVKHRSRFTLHPASNEVDTLGEVANVMVGWLLSKESRWEDSPAVADFEAQGGPVFWDYSMPEDYAGGLQDDFWPALACASTTDETGDVTSWAMVYDEPDATYDGRRWHTHVYLERQADDSCTVMVESSCRLMVDDPAGIAPSLAATPFSQELLELEGCLAQAGSVRLLPNVGRLSADTFDAFAAEVADSGRAVPYVLFCTNGSYGTAEYAKQLSRRTPAMANVYILNHEDLDLWEKARPFLDPEGTAIEPEEVPCRVYLPGGGVEEPGRALFAEFRPTSFASRIGREFLYAGEIPGVAEVRAAKGVSSKVASQTDEDDVQE